MKEMKEQDKRLKEMEIEEWQQRRLHRSPKPQKKRKTSSQKGSDSQDEEDNESQEEGEQKGKTGTITTKKVVDVISPNATAKTAQNDAQRQSERKESPKGRPKRIVSAKKAPEAPFIKAERVVKKKNLYETMRVSREVKDLGINEVDSNDIKMNYNTLSDYFKNREQILASDGNKDNLRIVTKR